MLCSVDMLIVRFRARATWFLAQVSARQATTALSFAIFFRQRAPRVEVPVESGGSKLVAGHAEAVNASATGGHLGRGGVRRPTCVAVVRRVDRSYSRCGGICGIDRHWRRPYVNQHGATRLGTAKGRRILVTTIAAGARNDLCTWTALIATRLATLVSAVAGRHTTGSNAWTRLSAHDRLVTIVPGMA